MKDVLFDLNPLPCWIYDARTLRLLDANAAFLLLLGLERSQMSEYRLPEPSSEAPRKATSPTADEPSTPLSIQHFRQSTGTVVQLEVREQPIEHQGQVAVLAMGQVPTEADLAAMQAEIARLKLFENIVMHTNDAVLVTEAEPVDQPGPRIVYVNEAFSKMTGYAAEEVLGKSPRLLQGPLSDFTALKQLGQSLRRWESHEVTTINYKKNGEPFWVNFSVTPIADSTGWFTHWIAIERDVTKSIELAEHLTKAKEQAEANERKMKEAQRLARLGSWYYDFINQISFWSEETYRIWGVDPARGVIPFEEHEPLVHPKDWPRFQAVISEAIAQGVPYKMELDLLRPDGSIKTVNTIGAPIFDDQQQLIAFEGTTQDISDRVAIENELRAAKDRAERMQYVISEASRLAKIGHVDHDFRTNIIQWSEYVYQLFGLPPSAPVLTEVQSTAHFDRVSQEKLAAARHALLSRGVPFDLELRMLNAAGQETFVRQVMQPVYNEAHEIVGKRGILQNITEQVYLQELNRDVARMVKMGSWRVDLLENTVYWSEQVHFIHGTDPHTFVPTLEADIGFYREDFHALVRQAVEAAIKKGSSWDFEAVIITTENKEVWIRSIGDAELVNGQCVGIFGGLQDIHEEKVAELALERFNEQLRAIAWTQSHLVRAPLSRILGIIDLIEREKTESGGMNDLLQHLKVATEEMDEIVKKIIREANQVSQPPKL